MPIGICQGLFALFTMYLPPLFPTLLRTTGAGFCYNIGRIAAAVATVFFGLFSNVGDHRLAILYSGLLFLPAAHWPCGLPNRLMNQRLRQQLLDDRPARRRSGAGRAPGSDR